MLVRHADLDDGQGIEDIELGHGPEVDAVDLAGIAADDGIEPAAAARPTRRRAEFSAARPQQVAGLVRAFGRERAGADARRVGFDHPDDTVDAARRQPAADAGAARRGIRRGHERIGAEVDVEHRSLRALEQQALARAVGGMHHRHGVDDQGLERRGRLDVAFRDGGGIERGRAQDGQVAVGRLDMRPDTGGEIGCQKIAQAQPRAVDLIGVAGADAAAGRADLPPLGPGLLLRGVERPVVAHDGMPAVADEQPALDRVALALQQADLVQQFKRIDDHAVADQADLAIVQNTRWNQVQHMLASADDDGMTGIAAPLEPDDQVGLRRQDVDDFPFSLVAPLGADQNGVGHNAPCCASPAPAPPGLQSDVNEAMSLPIILRFCELQNAAAKCRGRKAAANAAFDRPFPSG